MIYTIEYSKVVKLQHQCQILNGSPKGFTKSVSNNDGIGWKDGGFEEGEGDM